MPQPSNFEAFRAGDVVKITSASVCPYDGDGNIALTLNGEEVGDLRWSQMGPPDEKGNPTDTSKELLQQFVDQLNAALAKGFTP